MSRQAVAVILMAVLFGCAGGNRSRSSTATTSESTSGGVTPPAEAMSDTQLAAHAGNAQFPNTRPTDDRRLAAVVSHDRKTIKIYNFESNPIRAVNIWVNGSYVQPINGIAAAGPTDMLYNVGQRARQRGRPGADRDADGVHTMGPY
jgi:hypothetical protein